MLKSANIFNQKEKIKMEFQTLSALGVFIGLIGMLGSVVIAMYAIIFDEED
jgi:hypothetical protein